MRKPILSVLFIFAFVSSGYAQQVRKSEHWIFVWDVTLSMYGYNNEKETKPLFPDASDYLDSYRKDFVDKKNLKDMQGGIYIDKYDIYDKMTKVLTERIMKIEDDELGKISLIPFNNKVLDIYTVKATDKGKSDICSYINRYKNLQLTRTNIETPLASAMKLAEKSRECRTIIMLLTDGDHNMKQPSKQDFYNTLDNFCSFSEPNDAYLFYVMLTDFALERDPGMLPYLKACNRIKVIPPDEDLRLPVNVRFNGSMLYNLQDDGENAEFDLTVEVGGKLPENYSLRTTCEDNAYLMVDTTAQKPIDGKLRVAVGLKEGVTLRDVEQAFPRTGSKKLNIHIEPVEDDPYVVLMNEDCKLEVVNTPERKMTIRINQK